MDSKFSERVIVWVFRLAVDLGFRLNTLDHKRFRKLMDASFFLELQSKGFSQYEMAHAAGVAEGTVAGWKKTTRGLWAEPANSKAAKQRPKPLILRILDALEERGGSLDEFALEDACQARDKSKSRAGDDDAGFFQRFSLALRCLVAWGFVIERRNLSDITYHLTPDYYERVTTNLNEPFCDEVLVLDDLITVSVYILLMGEPQPESSLLPTKGEPGIGQTPERISRALSLCRSLQDEGTPCPVVYEEVEGERIYSLTAEARFLCSNEPSEYHLAAIRLVVELKSFLTWLATDPTPEWISQQIIMLRILPEDVPELYREHCEHFKGIAKQAEERAKGKARAVLCRLGWMGHVQGSNMEGTGEGE